MKSINQFNPATLTETLVTKSTKTKDDGTGLLIQVRCGTKQIKAGKPVGIRLQQIYLLSRTQDRYSPNAQMGNMFLYAAYVIIQFRLKTPMIS